MDKMIVWASLIGAVIMAVLVAFFNVIFRMPLSNKDKISRLEERLNSVMEVIEKEQQTNKENYKEIIKMLGGLQKQMNKISISIAKLEEKNE